MSRVEEIEEAIGHLPPEEFRRLLQWIRDREQANWDEQMDRDAASGRLDFLSDEAEAEMKEGLVRDWPPPE